MCGSCVPQEVGDAGAARGDAERREAVRADSATVTLWPAWAVEEARHMRTGRRFRVVSAEGEQRRGCVLEISR
jgi:hypothetical protein